ncbi:MAG: glucosamine-6-phosphate deaminase [Pirellulales bacterium]|nr:glucosamine-6-phosphate deaminase [Pirellulales bacterium]
MIESAVQFSPVERAALAASPFLALYAPDELIPVITVGNFPALGKLTAMRFLEWVQQHPEGVVSLPTGKTPEHFIKWVTHLQAHWNEPETQKTLEQSGVDPRRFPDMRGLHFVQIDEFYPIRPEQQNSFYHYVNEFYLKGFGLDRHKALLVDCTKIGLERGQSLEAVWPDFRVDLSLRTRQAANQLERLQQSVLRRIDDWCQAYEDKIRALGGIGFFLGGIGPDGHVGFNVRGSDHYSTTRLTATNYETQAAAAGDLGGVEISRNRLVITIGLKTITCNPDCAAIIVAAGEAKAAVVADAVRGPAGVLIPASALRTLPHARFYVTMGAAKKLRARQSALAAQSNEAAGEQIEMAVVDLSLANGKRILDLTEAEAKADPLLAQLLGKRPEPFAELKKMVRDRLVEKIEAGGRSAQNTRFLHTEPHHDDLMLGYLPAIVRNIRSATNVHHFATLTSGFTAVSNSYMLRRIETLKRFLETPNFADLHAEGYFAAHHEQGRNRDVWLYLDGLAARDAAMRDEGSARRLLRNFIAVFDENDLKAVRDRMSELEHYFLTVYPGRKDPDATQRLKGMCREWEAECLWGYFGWQCSHIHHLRLGFYTGDIFTPAPTVERDVAPILRTLEAIAPDIVSVAFDPEASGPDTHYKVLQALNEAVQRHAAAHGRPDIRIWGYRNVWFRFHPAEANIYVPVSMNMFSVMESAFMNTFVSQREASFPSYEHDGPFCELAQQIQVEQYQMLKTCLGREWFTEHPSPLIRCARGFVFLREMNLEEFRASARDLRQAAEAV